ncbi:MAG: hypothetical protein ACH346_01895 [Chthoniobacterales bacterium]
MKIKNLTQYSWPEAVCSKASLTVQVSLVFKKKNFGEVLAYPGFFIVIKRLAFPNVIMFLAGAGNA